ncbi:ABC transporter substrate-binding protein [Celeribacter halophilus]|uniref:ABC transporter substrate-binding protein n=1 Tax=Celeribacter halophilus TaxID=576117 RepID=UPI001C088316|nr:ABC transporter substrate-binding protein [Celeribacter halophilus]MBU2888125.1 ABC transporter substrate-binding protein [Celeribacter halophilus]MDO6511871.1 ABC transporter substrate-binding protein [Celeribacter halophilus]
MSLGITGSVTDRLDPATWTGHAMPTFGKTWGETLVEPDPVDKSPVPVLAETWEADEAAKIWTFTLRQGVTFHNGQPMTSEDVVKTLRRHSDEKSQSAALGALGDIASIDADGPGKVVVRLKSGNLDLPLLLSDYHLIIQPGGGVDKPDAGIGTGPYRVVSVEAGIKYVSEKVLGHWREDVGHVDRIEMMIINDDTARLSALRSGRVHMINQVDPKTAKLLERVGKVSVENTQGGGHYTFSMRTDIAPFDNADLRLAMKYAIDRSELVERILQGYGTVGNDYPINATYPMAPEEIEQRGYDPELARRHFVKSGHKGPVTLHVSDAAFAGAVDAAVLFQASAARAGIEIDVQRVPADGYWSDVWNKVPFSASYWTSRPVQDHIYSTAYMSGLPWNETHWSRPDFDDLVLAARIEADPVKRQKLFKDMALMVRNEGGVIIPMFNDFIDAVSDEVGGYIKDTSGPLSNYFAPIRCWLGTSL